MSSVVPSDIERAVGRLSAARPRGRAPIVQFAPIYAEPLPEARRRKRALVWTSIGAHIVLAVVLMLLPRRANRVDEPALPINIVFVSPIPEVPALELPKPEPIRKAMPLERPKPVAPKPQPVVAKVEPPAPVEPEPPPPPVAAPEPKPQPVVAKVEPAPASTVEPAKPRPAVKTGLLDESPGPPIAASTKSRSALVVASGFDTEIRGSVARARPGGIGVVQPTGFSETAAAPARSRGRGSSAGVVQETGFSEEGAAPAPKKREPERAVSPLDAEVEILSRAKPVYTEEARALRLEGDVVLSVVFEAGGVLKILGVAQGLGHGLDEAAVEAAKKIRFNPARRDGHPVDHAARLRVVFRLA